MISEDSDSSSSVVPCKRRKGAKKTRKRRKKKENTESENSSSEDSSSSDEERPRKKRPVIKRKIKKRVGKEDTESESSSSKDSSSSDEEQPRKKRPFIKRKIKKRLVIKRKIKKRVEKEDTESESSSSKDSSSSDGEQPRKKRPFIKRKNKKRVGKEDTESESSSSKDSSSSDGEVSPKQNQIKKTQNRDIKEKIYTKGNEKQPKKFQTRRNSSQSNQYQKPFDDTLTQSTVKGLSIKMKSVGVLVSYGDPVGTVFRVGDKYVMTAFHVIKGIPGNYRFENKKTFVNFNESPCTHDITFTFKRLVFYDEELDFAVLEVSKPERLPKGLKLSKLNCDELGGTRLSIIGYGHPGQHKKTLDPCCHLIEANSPRILQAQQWFKTNSDYHKRILKGTGQNPSIVDIGFGNLNDPRIFTIDSFMEQGVSGAPALVASGYNGRMKVSGLMTHGIPEFFYLLPKLVTSGRFPPEHRFARGTTMKAIYTCIRKENRKLANELFN